MLDKLQKKMVNVFLFFDLMKLNRKYPKGDDYIRLKKSVPEYRGAGCEAGGYPYCGGFGEAAASHQG